MGLFGDVDALTKAFDEFQAALDESSDIVFRLAGKEVDGVVSY